MACSLAILTPMASAQQLGAANGVGSQFELAFWQSVAGSDDRSQLEAYLAQYPNGTFAALARAKITAIDKRDAYARGVVSPAPAPMPGPMVAAPLAGAAAMTAAAAPPSVPAVATAVPATAAMTQPAIADQSLSDQLRALGQSQGLPAASMQASIPAATIAGVASPATPSSGALAGAASALPSRPQLASLSDVALPDHFCSALERNGFYDSVFTPAKDAAEQNNQTAIAHMQKLRQLYDSLAQSQVQNAPTMNVIAGEAKDYEAVAADAYGKSAAYEGLFTRLMAVPVRKCS